VYSVLQLNLLLSNCCTANRQDLARHFRPLSKLIINALFIKMPYLWHLLYILWLSYTCNIHVIVLSDASFQIQGLARVNLV